LPAARTASAYAVKHAVGSNVPPSPLVDDDASADDPLPAVDESTDPLHAVKAAPHTMMDVARSDREESRMEESSFVGAATAGPTHAASADSRFHGGSCAGPPRIDHPACRFSSGPL
jgi:hypothetical protein